MSKTTTEEPQMIYTVVKDRVYGTWSVLGPENALIASGLTRSQAVILKAELNAEAGPR